MPINTLAGTTAADSRIGTEAADLITGFAQHGATSANPTTTLLAGGFTQATFATAPPDDSSRLFVTGKEGRIDILDLATSTHVATPFLDLTGSIGTDGEEGLLGLAFDPNYAANRIFYVFVSNAAGDSEIRRYRANPTDPNRADASAFDLILRIDQLEGYNNHKGGWIGFGPDGFLYASIGDGGGGGDPFGNGQNPNVLPGKMLRLDVGGADAFPADATRNYAIPADNPFGNEIYALGLRNAWRNSFDRGTGDFYIADVGQGQFEEIDLGASGANYGWGTFEGPVAYAGGNPSTAGFTFPIHSYGRSTGASITGGYAYRGPQEGLFGSYIFADFVSGKIWSLADPEGDGSYVRTELVTSGTLRNISSFGEDAEGRLYVLDIDGELYRFDPVATSADSGADTLDGGGGDDRIFGGGGGDLLIGRAGTDLLSGMAGDDLLYAGDGADRLIGGDGRDTLQGEGGDDHLLGGAGDDEIDGGAGADTLAGGDGDDKLVVRELGDILVESSGGGQDSAFVFVSGYTLGANVEIAYLRGSAIALTGSDGAEQLVANGASTLNGRGGSDVLWGSAAADTLDGGAGDDILRGQGGADRMLGGTGNDQFVIFDPGAAAVELAGEGIDTAWVASSGWTVGANIEFARLTGSGASLTGSAGNDVLVANPLLASTLQGGAGQDTLWGSAFAESFAGGAGDDVIYSLGGADRYLFATPGWGFDQISGFSREAGQKIVLSGLGTDYATIGAGLTFGGGDTQINLGVDRVLVYGITNLLESDFIF